MRKLIRFNSIFILLMVVSFTVAGQYSGSNPNVAQLKTATASDSLVGFEPAKAIDNQLATALSIQNGPPSWFQVDLGAFYHIDGVGMNLPNGAELPLTFNIQGSLNGSDWFLLEPGNASVAGTVSYDLTNPDEYRYVRLNILTKDLLATIAEFYVYGYLLVEPDPPLALPATNQTISGFTANWDEANEVEGYQLAVYDKLTSTIVPGYDFIDVGNVLTYDVTGLTLATEYYYNVKAYNFTGSGFGSNFIYTATLSQQAQTITFATLPAKIYGEADFALTATASSGLTVSYASSDETVATVTGNTVTIVGVGITDITATQAGNVDYQAALPVVQDLEITEKELTISGVVAENKIYDALADASLSGGTLDGIVGTDVVDIADATSGAFAQTDVGTGIVVTTLITLTGADMANYTLAQPTVTADITVKELTVTGMTAADKVYDGTTDASLSGGSLVGVIGTDIVNLTDANSGVLAQSDVGADIGVTTSVTLSGAASNNYSVMQPSDITGAITVKDLTVTPDAAVREACKANPDFTLVYTGFVGAEDKSVLPEEPVASSTADETSTPGPYDITATGGDGGNYNLVFEVGTLTVTSDVSDPALSVQNISIQLDDDGNVSITAADVVVRAFDDCGTADTILSKSTFTRDDVGDVVVDVTVTDAAGNSTIEYAVVTVEDPLGYQELAAIGAKIYPNPTKGMVELEINTSVDILKVMDMTGKTIISRSNLKAQESIDLSEFSNGIYIFQLTIGEDLKHIKIIKE